MNNAVLPSSPFRLSSSNTLFYLEEQWEELVMRGCSAVLAQLKTWGGGVFGAPNVASDQAAGEEAECSCWRIGRAVA